MTRRLGLLLLLLGLLVNSAAVATVLDIRPPREIAPGTRVVRYDGHDAAIGSSGEGFAAVAQSMYGSSGFFRRFDAAGHPLDPVGVPLPFSASSMDVAWSGTAWIVAAAISGRDGLWVMRIASDGTFLDAEPRQITTKFGANVRLTVSGPSILVTWLHSAGLTDYLSGLLLSRDLDVVRPAFAIDTRARPIPSGPSDPDWAPSIVGDGRSFLMAWENRTSPLTHTFRVIDPDGTVSDGATIASELPVLQPRLVTTAAGHVFLWHDGSAIRAVRVAGDGTAVGSAIELFSDHVIELAAVANGTEVGLVWTSSTGVVCDIYGRPLRTIKSLLVDQSLAITSPTRSITSIPSLARLIPESAAATSAEMMFPWAGVECPSARYTHLSAELLKAERSEPVTGWLDTSLQLDPAAASDGTNALVVWSEHRDDDPAARIHGALLDADANVVNGALVMPGGESAQQSAQVAFGAGRYLVLWEDASGTYAQFVSRGGELQGERFTLGETPSPPFVVWDGAEFSAVWSEGNGFELARITTSGRVTRRASYPEAGKVVIGGAATGPGGEIAIVYTVESESLHEVHLSTFTGVLRNDTVLSSARRPCLSLACIRYVPFDVEWNGSRYVALWGTSERAGTGSYIDMASPGVSTVRVAWVYEEVWYRAEGGVQLAWNGAELLAAYRLPGLTSWWAQTAVGRLDEAQGKLQGTFVTFTAAESSNPAIVNVTVDRALVVYSEGHRLFARAVPSVPVPPRRRASGTR